MERLTYKQAFDKITEAYIRGEIKPFDSKFCFCGTLANGRQTWCQLGKFRAWSHHYNWFEYGKMEQALFSTFPGLHWLDNGNADFEHTSEFYYSMVDFEDRLFNGMCAALEVLKQIHKERGENVEDFQFTKRQLA